MNINIEAELHHAFKAATAKQGEKMTDVLTRFIQQYVKKNQFEGKTSKGGRS